MRKLTTTIVAMTALFLANAPGALAGHSSGGGSTVGYFYLTEIGTATSVELTTSTVFSTLSACTTASEAGGQVVVYQCAADCAPPSTTVFFLEQAINGKFHGYGPYGFESDCEAASESGAAAVSANSGDQVDPFCTSVTAKHGC